jgi:hypothetical protein
VILPGEAEEISPEERRETAIRYRRRRTEELNGIATRAVGGPVEAVGPFMAAAASRLAAVPVIGIFILPLSLLWARRRGLPDSLLLALDESSLHLIDTGLPTRARPHPQPPSVSRSYPRAGIRVGSIRRVLTDDEVRFEIPEHPDLVLYAPSLRTNPWSAELVRLLGGEVPEPIDPTAA